MTTAPAKPAYGQPCNGCGVCCLAAQCPISTAVFGRVPVCPALEPVEAGGYRCGLIAAPGPYLDLPPHWAALTGEAFGVILGAGSGCDAAMSDADHDAAEADAADLRQRARKAYRDARPEVRDLIDHLAPGHGAR